ncbi:hypothetical protein [Streptomyces sp. NPDC056061]|uniref:hypothetical protein n=1 Tax=Streptomyces sp. NPDC056061 TaxID=3345700 RepID=UPI0035DA9728
MVWDGVDLFGHPAEEILSVLPESVPLPGAGMWVAVPALSLCLGRDDGSGERWQRVVLAGAGGTGWSGCCRGRFGCAEGGDGLRGILY